MVRLQPLALQLESDCTLYPVCVATNSVVLDEWKVQGRDVHVSFRLSMRRLAATLLLGCFLLLALGVGDVAALAASERVPLGRFSPVALAETYRFALQPPGDSQEKQGLVWLDNERVMFTGATIGKGDTRGLYIWNVFSGAVSVYGSYTRFCYADGYIVAEDIRLEPGKPRIWPVRSGRLGEEEDSSCHAETGKGCPGQLNMSCKPRQFIGPAPIGKEAMYEIELRDGDGVIVNPVSLMRVWPIPKGTEAQREYFSRPYLLVGKRYPEGKALPISAVEEIDSWNTSYSVYARRYVFLSRRPADGQVGLLTNWPGNRPQPIYLMDEEGTVGTISLTPRPEWSHIFQAQLAAPGVVFRGVAGPRNDWGGLFLYATPSVFALDRGKVDAMSVTPNGCRVAYAIFNDYGNTPINNSRVKYIDFCAGQSK